MVYTVVINIVYSNLNSIFNILNAIVTKYQFFACKSNLKCWNCASWFSYDFLKILTIWASFSYKLFSFKKTCTLFLKSLLFFTKKFCQWLLPIEYAAFLVALFQIDSSPKRLLIYFFCILLRRSINSTHACKTCGTGWSKRIHPREVCKTTLVSLKQLTPVSSMILTTPHCLRHSYISL